MQIKNLLTILLFSESGALQISKDYGLCHYWVLHMNTFFSLLGYVAYMRMLESW